MRSFGALLAIAIFSAAADLRAGEATVYRDRYGVPHVWAEDYASAGYAVGRAQCEDSLQNVIYCLHAGVGRLSEVFGPAGRKADIEARKLRHGVFAEAAWPALCEPVRALVVGFCAGVNDYMREHPEELPVPIDEVTPVQVIAWHRRLMLRPAVAISKADAEASKADGYHPFYNPGRVGAAAHPASKEDETLDEEEPHPGIAPGKSNSWAVAGSRTASGVPLLLIDPHWASEGHLQLYEMWLHVADEMHVGGYALTGVPLPGLGVSSHAAWTFTAGGADSADAYALQINPENPHQYRFDDRWEDMEVREETIRIRQDDGSFTEENFEVLATRHGPVLETKGGVPFAAAMGGYDRADGLDQTFLMCTAKSTAEFKAALALDRLSFFNLMWATAEGDIGYVQTGQAPLRPEGFNWSKMVPGWTSASAYYGRVPFDGLPAVENPVTGFLQNCNTAANVVTPGLTFTKEDFPPNVLWGHYGQYRARGARATQLLTELDDATLEDGRRIAFDTYVPPADLWVPVILQGYAEWKQLPEYDATTESSRRLEEAVRLIGTWNRYATKDSPGATVFRFWRLACHEMDSSVGRDDFEVSNTQEIRRDAVKALQTAADRLNNLYGTVRVNWGDIKRLRRGGAEWPVSGDGLGKLGMDTLRATAGDTFNEEHKLIADGGQCVTSVVLLTNPPQIRAVVAYGQSNKPDSPHYADQAPLYSAEQLREVPWTREQLQRQIWSETTYQFEL